MRATLKNDKTRYRHTVVTPVLVAPGKEHVIALAPEFVTPQDGQEKQDCELSAGGRWLERWGAHYSSWGITLLGDDLYCHQPFCERALAKPTFRYFFPKKLNLSAFVDEMPASIFLGLIAMLKVTESVKTQVLDHHGLIAATCEELRLGERIDKRLGQRGKRIVSFGKASVAMVLNGLGFTGRPLYLTPQFFENKAMEALLGSGIEAQHLNDDALGDTLDAIAAYGPSKLFAEVAHEVALVEDLLNGLTHVDTTSFSVAGEYAITEAEKPEEKTNNPQVIKLTHGFSKDHRPDLKQAVLSMAVAGGSGVPLWMTPCDGNASDKKTLPETIERVEAFRRAVDCTTPTRWIADCALYTAPNLLKMKDTLWVSRVPETVKEAKALVAKPTEEIAWVPQENGYQTAAFHSNYAGIGQRWLLVFSAQAYQREKKTLYRRLDKQEEALKKRLKHFGNEVFSCEKDAEKALEKHRKSYHLFTLTSSIVPVEKYATRGRPKGNQEKQCVGYRVETAFARNEAAIMQLLNTKGRFILATNDLDKNSYPDERLFADYKSQQTVENGFRFLKNPEFIADTLFLKSAKRIGALMMIMTLCLFVYAIAQHRLRQKLLATNETLPNQLGKFIQTPTLRWIFQLMEGVALVRIMDNANTCLQIIVANLDHLRKKIIRLFGKCACEIYQISEVA